MNKYIWNGNEIKIINDGWYNISTKRVVTKNNRRDLIYINDIHICGNKNDVDNFKIENKIYDDKIKTTNMDKIKKFFLKIFYKNDIESLSEEEYGSMCLFLMNFSGKGRIVNYVDGDTVDILMYIKLKELEKEMVSGRKKEIKKTALVNDKKGGFFGVFRCRLNGIDAAEKDTNEGQFAKQKLIEYFSKTNNIVYFDIVNKPNEREKFGRQLVELYLDFNKQNSCKKYMLNLRNEKGLAVVLEYDGGKKSSLMSDLPKINK